MQKLWPLALLAAVTACVDEPTTLESSQFITAGFAVPVGVVWPSSTIRVCWTAGGVPMSSSTAGALAAELDGLEAIIHAAWEPTVNVHWAFSRDCVADYDVALDVRGNQSISYGRDLHGIPPVGIDFAVQPESAAERHARLRDEALLASGRILGLEWFVFDPSESCQSPFRRGCADQSPLLPSSVLAATALYGGAPGIYITPLGQCMQTARQSQTWKPPYLTVRDCGTPTPAWWDRHTIHTPSGVIATLLSSRSMVTVRTVPDFTYMWEPASTGTLTSVGGRCLTLGEIPSYRSCENTANQTPTLFVQGGWKFPVRLGTKCLRAASATQLETVECPPNEAQWDWRSGGVLYNLAFDRCLTIPDGGGEEDAPVTLEPCRVGATNQRWTFSGAVRTGIYNESPGVWGVPSSASEQPVVLSTEPDRYDANGNLLEVRERWWSFVP